MSFQKNHKFLITTLFAVVLTTSGLLLHSPAKVQPRFEVPAFKYLSSNSLEPEFLEALRDEQIPVNEIRFQGQIEEFDAGVILPKDFVTQMVYRHATRLSSRQGSSNEQQLN